MDLFSFKPKKKEKQERLYRVTLEDVSEDKQQPTETMVVNEDGEQR